MLQYGGHPPAVDLHLPYNMRQQLVAAAVDVMVRLTSVAGPSVVTGVVFKNFSLSDPTVKQGQVLWPIGLLQPGVQQGTNAPLRLLLQDVEILVDADTLQQYIRYFKNQGTLVYTVRHVCPDSTAAAGTKQAIVQPSHSAVEHCVPACVQCTLMAAAKVCNCLSSDACRTIQRSCTFHGGQMKRPLRRVSGYCWKFLA